MKQPPRFFNPQFLYYFFRLCKSIYGLKYTSRSWYQLFVVYITSIGFLSICLTSLSLLFIEVLKEVYLLIYVDDILLMTLSFSLITTITTRLATKFPMSDLGLFSFYLGNVVLQAKYGHFLSYTTFAKEIIDLSSKST